MAKNLNLYSLVLVHLLSYWISEWELFHLDCVVTNNKLRECFLRVLSTCSVANFRVRNECYNNKFEKEKL